MPRTIIDAQKLVKQFAKDRGWVDEPNIDKFDHLHEELIEMSQHLRYKSSKERKDYVRAHRDYFMQEAGDLLFGVLRLANQLGVDLEEGFEATLKKASKKYKPGPETNVAWKK